MNCPYCKKEIYGMTGLQEVQKFQKHLRTCRKNPENKLVITPEGDIKKQSHNPDLLSALKIRHESGQ